MIFRRTQNGEIFRYEFQVETESCFEIRDRVFQAFWHDLSIDMFNLRFRYRQKNIIDFDAPLINLVDSQDEVIECDILQIIKGNVLAYPILETGEQVEISFTSSECIMSLKNDIASRLGYNVDDFVLFLNYEWLDEETYIYQYEIAEGSVIHYVFLDRTENFQKLNDERPTGEYSTSFNARVISTGELIRVKRYSSTTASEEVAAYNPMIRQIVSFNKIWKHPRFVQLKSFSMQGQDFLLGVELITGGSLHEFVETHRPLHVNVIVRISKQILEALVEMDDLHIYHCYLNSGNILLDNNNDIKISGFSLSRLFTGKTCNEMFEGFTVSKNPPTLNFSSPEIINQGHSGLQSDIWAFGAILIEMVTGYMPFYNWTSNQIIEELTTNGTIPFQAPGLAGDSFLRTLIGRCLRTDAHERPRPNVLLNDLSEFYNAYNSSLI